MKYSNVDQWKSRMRVLAKEKGIDVQQMQQRYVLEEFARKIGKSKYKDSIVFKGGFVVSALLGIDERKTRDIDFTFSSTIYSIGQIEEVLKEIVSTEIDAFFDYEIVCISEEQLDDYYSGFSCMITAVREKTRLYLKVNVSNNTLIYPESIEMQLHSFIDEETIDVMTYPIENIIAEKYETTLDRGIFNSRMRDLFDIYYLFTNNHHLIDDTLLVKTIIAVSNDRNTYSNLLDVDEILKELLESRIFRANFESYKRNNYVYKEETLEDIFYVFRKINDLIQLELESK